MLQSATGSLLSREELLDVLRRMSVTLVITNLDGDIVDANDTVETMYGYAVDELVGKKFRILCSDKNPVEIVVQAQTQCLLNGWRGEILSLRKNGEEFPVTMTSSPLTDKERNVTLVANFIYEIPEKRRTENEFLVLEHQLRALKGVTSAAAQLTNPDELPQILLDQLIEVSGMDAGALFIQEKAGGFGLACLKDMDSAFSLKFLNCTGEECGHEPVSLDSPWFHEDLASRRRCTHAKQEGCSSAIRLPLVARQRLVGVLVLSSREKGTFTEEEKELLVAMGREVGILMENANLFRALQEAYDELHATYEVSVAISQSIDLERTLKHIVKSAQKALNASNCFLFLLEEKRNELVGAASTTQDEDFKDLRIGMRETVAGVWVVKEKLPLSIRDLSSDPRACPALRDRYHQKSALFAPLIVNDAAIGTLVLDDTERERVFSEGDIRRAQAIANQAGLAIQRARLYQAVKEKVQEVTVLYEVGRALTSTLRPESVLDQMMHILRESFGYVHCAILLVGGEKELYVKAASGYAGEGVNNLRLKVGNEGITGWVAATGQPLYVPDVQKDPRYVPGMKGVRSEIALPLKIGQNVLGVLNVESTELGAFHERDVRILSSLAAQAAVAIENARLYAEIEKKAEELDVACRDLEISRQSILKANERLQEVDRLKSEFLATMSHELRTPLTSIIAYSELLGDERVDEARRSEFLEIITEQGNRLLQLITDLLDLSKLECGKMQLILEPANLNEIILSAVETTRPTADKKGLEVFTDLAPALPLVSMDTKRIRQVCWNLLCNAVKFTDFGGKITVRSEESGAELVVRISDTGVGIRPEDIERIFDRFAQVDSSATREHGGVGLGLDLVRRFVTLHSGRVWVESEYGRGSSFFFTLPKERELPPAHEADPEGLTGTPT
ncbi:MAG: GAF domain-containing protein [Candidatus Eisenbacteria bacterium]|nr:GAF domain-containing protein [Candidatus Eisenbacteria bacterium]